jgi:aminoglycoside 6'-N-acetyltransferase I
MDYSITRLESGDETAIQQTADVLTAAFPNHPAWSHYEKAFGEVIHALLPPGICKVARSRDGVFLGWIGATPMYEGNVWEIHPLAVHPDFQNLGIGRALIADIEEIARGKGGLTLWLGTDDENNRTSLGGADLYPNLLENLASIKDRSGHPFAFYLKLGFVFAGVLPDANGRGKPDIYMAKRL